MDVGRCGTCAAPIAQGSHASSAQPTRARSRRLRRRCRLTRKRQGCISKAAWRWPTCATVTTPQGAHAAPARSSRGRDRGGGGGNARSPASGGGAGDGLLGAAQRVLRHRRRGAGEEAACCDCTRAGGGDSGAAGAPRWHSCPRARTAATRLACLMHRRALKGAVSLNWRLVRCNAIAWIGLRVRGVREKGLCEPLLLTCFLLTTLGVSVYMVQVEAPNSLHILLVYCIQ